MATIVNIKLTRYLMCKNEGSFNQRKQLEQTSDKLKARRQMFTMQIGEYKI